LVVYSGIGEVDAALCMYSVLSEIKVNLSMSVGTAGQSSVMGGFMPQSGHMDSTKTIRDEGCQPLTNATATPLALGSVCIASGNFNLFCSVCHPGNFSAENQCQRPNCAHGGDVSLSGVCNFKYQSDFVKRVSAAASQAILPPMGKQLELLSGNWWKADEAFGETKQPTMPRVIDNCGTAESANLIGSGLPLDIFCRDIVSKVLGIPVRDAVCYAAMEGGGFARAAQQVAPEMPYLAIRGGSNYDRFPLQNKNGEQWVAKIEYTSPEEMAALTREGYHFAIETTNAVVLAFLKDVSQQSYFL